MPVVSPPYAIDAGQHVTEPATKPRLILRLVAPDINRLVEDVCVVPSRRTTSVNADPRLIHQVVVTRTPESSLRAIVPGTRLLVASIVCSPTISASTGGNSRCQYVTFSMVSLMNVTHRKSAFAETELQDPGPFGKATA